MTGTGHVWELRGAWDVCTRCGVTLDRLLTAAPCRGFVAPLEPRDGEQSPTSDESAIARLRLEVSALTSLADAREAEVDRLRRLVTAAAAALDGLLTDVAALGFQVHPRVASHLHRMAHDLRGALDQGAAR